ncbi:hypothetical protein JCM16418A_26130 [Paenibacillus pini]
MSNYIFKRIGQIEVGSLTFVWNIYLSQINHFMNNNNMWINFGYKVKNGRYNRLKGVARYAKEAVVYCGELLCNYHPGRMLS